MGGEREMSGNSVHLHSTWGKKKSQHCIYIANWGNELAGMKLLSGLGKKPQHHNHRIRSCNDAFSTRTTLGALPDKVHACA